MIIGIVASGVIGDEDASGGGDLWTPENLTKKQGWYDASDDTTITLASGAVSQWDDKSGNALHISQSTSTMRPTVQSAAQNGLDVIRFDGIDDVLHRDSLSIFTAASYAWMFCVYKKRSTDGSATNRGMLSGLGASTNAGRFGMYAGRTEGANEPSMTARRLDGDSIAVLTSGVAKAEEWIMMLGIMDWSEGDGFIYLDGELVATDTTMTSEGSTTATTDRLCVGAALTTGLLAADIDLAEVLMGNETDVLSSNDIDTIFGYIAWKWGLEDNLPVDHPYKDAAPTV